MRKAYYAIFGLIILLVTAFVALPDEDPVEIEDITAEPLEADTRTPVLFTADVDTEAPVVYTWSFGDGTTTEGASATHTFDNPGTYEVTLSVAGEDGIATRAMNLTVTPYEPDHCATLAEMNAAFFERNSSELTDAGRAMLRENVDVLKDCEDLEVVVEGWAADSEDDGDELSAERAAAIRAFYLDNGLADGRIVVEGRGSVGDISTKEGAPLYRRGDSTPRQ